MSRSRITVSDYLKDLLLIAVNEYTFSVLYPPNTVLRSSKSNGMKKMKCIR